MSTPSSLTATSVDTECLPPRDTDMGGLLFFTFVTLTCLLFGVQWTPLRKRLL